MSSCTFYPRGVCLDLLCKLRLCAKDSSVHNIVNDHPGSLLCRLRTDNAFTEHSWNDHLCRILGSGFRYGVVATSSLPASPLAKACMLSEVAAIFAARASAAFAHAVGRVLVAHPEGKIAQKHPPYSPAFVCNCGIIHSGIGTNVCYPTCLYGLVRGRHANLSADMPFILSTRTILLTVLVQLPATQNYGQIYAAGVHVCGASLKSRIASKVCYDHTRTC